MVLPDGSERRRGGGRTRWPQPQEVRNGAWGKDLPIVLEDAPMESTLIMFCRPDV